MKNLKLLTHQRTFLGCSKDGQVAPTGKIKQVQHFGSKTFRELTFFDQDNPAGTRDFFLLQNVENSPGAHPAACA